MKTHKWALRIIGALLGFTAVIWIAAPVTAAEISEESIQHEAACYLLAKVAGDEYQINRHMFNLKTVIESDSYTIIHTIGYTEGYLSAVAYITKVPRIKLAMDRYASVCLEQSWFTWNPYSI